MKEPRPSKGPWQESLKDSSPYLGLGLQLAGSVLVYVGTGYLLDRWLDTEPWFLLAGAVLGMGAFFLQLFRVVREMNKATAARAARYADLGKNADRDEWEDPPDDDWKEWSDED